MTGLLNGDSREMNESMQSSARKDPTAHTGSGKPIEVLLVEDSPDDACWTMEALREGKVRNRVTWVEDGVEALAYLRNEGEHATAHRPDLVLLDLNLPKKNGREVLKEIKKDPDLKRIPVVIMTMSDDQKDIDETYDLHANCYVTKPVDLNRFMGVVRQIEDFWLTVVKLPAA
jgi:two-component system, chemotaxis family, response regulator Rcp1